MPFIELVAQRTRPTPPAGMQPPENAKDWFRMEAAPQDPDATDVYIYSSIGGWFGMWADEFISELKAVTTSKINLRINSPGGSVFDGIAIANAIRSHPATVTVYVDSLAASIASVIALAGDRTVMMPSSQFMVHNASGACYGDATEMTKMADLLDKQSRNIAQAYAQHTGGSLAEWQDYMAAETWFTAEEAVAVGLADELMPMRTKEAAPAEDAMAAKMQHTWDLSMYRYPGRTLAPAPQVAAESASGEFAAGGFLTAAMVNGITASAGEPIVPAKLIAELSTDDLQKLIVDTVAAQLEAKLPAFLQPDEDEDDEDEAEDASTEEPTDQTPEGPGEEQQIVPESGDTPAVEQHTPEEIPPDPGEHTTETYDEADDWTQVVGFLASPTTSPSADDVFAQLKEGWK